MCSQEDINNTNVPFIYCPVSDLQIFGTPFSQIDPTKLVIKTDKYNDTKKEYVNNLNVKVFSYGSELLKDGSISRAWRLQSNVWL